jgi:hypothetical protein
MEEGEISDSDSEYGSSGAGEEEEVSPASPLPQVLEVTTAPPSLIPLHRDSSDNDDEVEILDDVVVKLSEEKKSKTTTADKKKKKNADSGVVEKYKKYWEVYEEEFESQGADKKTKIPSKAVLMDTTDVITVDDAAEDSGGKKRDEKESEEEGAAPNALFWKSIHKTSSGGVSAEIPSQVLFQRRHELEAASLFSRRPASAASSPSPPAVVVVPAVPVAACGAAPAAESGGVTSHHPSWTAGEESQLFQRRSSLKIDFPSLAAATGGPGTTAAAVAPATTTPQRARAEGGPEKAPSASFWGPLRGKAKPPTNSPATTAAEATPMWGPNRFLNPSSPAEAAVPVQPLRQPLPAASVKLPPLVITAPPNSRVKGVPLLLAKAMREAVVVTSAAGGAAATSGAASLETTNLSSSITASGSDNQRELRSTSQPGGGRSDRQPERHKSSSQRGERSGSQPTKRSGSRRRDDSSERRKRSRRTRTRSRLVSLRFFYLLPPLSSIV